MSADSENIVDAIMPVLQNIQRDITDIKTDIGMIKADMQSMNMRLVAVESHMSGFMSTTRYLDVELDSVRGRIEALEEDRT